MSKTAVFPGSFDPITKGHFDIITRALPMFDTIIIAVGKNASKKNYFALEKRVGWIEKLFAGNSKVKVKTYSGLTIDFCREEKASYIIRGLRTSADFEFERGIAQVNQALDSKVDTVFMIAQPSLTHITSSIVREVLKHGGDATQFVPPGISLI
jgi:pantetheine-phosphate adenylyltransferase